MPGLLEGSHIRGNIEFGTSVALLCAACITTILRTYVRVRLAGGLKWDDILMIVTTTLFTGYCVTLIKTVMICQGTTIDSYGFLEAIINYSLATEDLYLITVIFLKLSLGIFFLRIFSQPWQRATIYLVIVISTIANFIAIFPITFVCGNPANYLMNFALNKCMSRTTQMGLTYCHSGINCLTGWVLVLMPIPTILSARITRFAKTTVTLILLIATVGSISSSTRLLYLKGLVSISNVFWSATELAIWSTAELGTGILAGNFIAMRPLLEWLLGGIETADAKDLKRSKYERTSDHDTPSPAGQVGARAAEYRFVEPGSVRVTSSSQKLPQGMEAGAAQWQRSHKRSASMVPSEAVEVLKLDTVADDLVVHDKETARNSLRPSPGLSPIDEDAESFELELVKPLSVYSREYSSRDAVWNAGVEDHSKHEYEQDLSGSSNPPPQPQFEWQRIQLESGEQAWVRKPANAASHASHG